MRPEPAIRKKRQATSFGEIAYLEAGPADRPPVLFVHGFPTSAFLWRHVLRLLQNDFHCYAPDLMGLGDTEVAPSVKHLHMEAQAEMLLEFAAAVGCASSAVVAHDQGGAAAQIIAARQPGRISGLVLADSVCFDNWPVPLVARLQWYARYLAPLMALPAAAGLIEFLEKRTPLSSFRKGVVQRERLTDEAIAEYLRPMRRGPVARQRFLEYLLAGSARSTQQAVDGLRAFSKPTLILWAADDRYISPSWGLRLAEEIPGALRCEIIPFCGHFWPEERPAEFAVKIGGFLSGEVFCDARCGAA